MHEENFYLKKNNPQETVNRLWFDRFDLSGQVEIVKNLEKDSRVESRALISRVIEQKLPSYDFTEWSHKDCRPVPASRSQIVRAPRHNPIGLCKSTVEFFTGELITTI